MELLCEKLDYDKFKVSGCRLITGGLNSLTVSLLFQRLLDVMAAEEKNSVPGSGPPPPVKITPEMLVRAWAFDCVPAVLLDAECCTLAFRTCSLPRWMRSAAPLPPPSVWPNSAPRRRRRASRSSPKRRTRRSVSALDSFLEPVGVDIGWLPCAVDAGGDVYAGQGHRQVPCRHRRVRPSFVLLSASL